MKKDDLYKKLMDKFLSAKESREEWHKEAIEAYNLFHGNQWSKEDIASMRCSGRPHLTFNNVQPFINAISGSEIGNKQVIKYYPREPGDLKADEILTAIADWFRESTMGDEVDTTIFKDSLICGMGWSETTLDYTNNPDGDPCIRRLDPLKMYWDNNGLEDNLKNAKYLFYVNTLPLEELKEMFPKADESDFNAADSDEEDAQLKNIGTVIEARYRVKKKFVRYVDPFTQMKVDVTEEAFKEFQKGFPELQLDHQTFTKEVVKKAFLGATKLLEDPSEVATNDISFGWNAITAYCDNINKQYYGIIKGMKDSQLCINKFFSETVFNYNVQGKGGFFIEEGALVNPQHFANNHTDPTVPIWLNSGGLNKIQPRPVAQVSQVLPQLLNFAENQMNQVVGVSKEFLGTRDVNQPGVLEQQRRQSTLNILSPLFENLKAYRAAQGSDILYLIQNYLADGRLVKIVGQDKAQYIPLAKEVLSNKEYDVIVDDAPLSLNSQERDYQTVMQMLPLFGKDLTPELLLEVMKLSPLPSDFIEKAEQVLQSQKPDPQQQAQQEAQQQQMQQAAMQAQQQQQQMQSQKTQADIVKSHAQAQKDVAQADRNSSLAQMHKIQAAEAVQNAVQNQQAAAIRNAQASQIVQQLPPQTGSPYGQ